MTETVKEEVKVEEVAVNEYKLIKPVLIDGNMVDTIRYDLEELTGDDVSMAVKELAKQGVVVTMTEFDQNYHAMIFAISAGISYEDVKRMKMKDFTKVCNIVRDFFLNE